MSAKAEFDAAVEAKMARGMSRERAVSAVVKERPELQERLVAEANEGRDVRDRR